ncbi:penicillin-binding protein 2 [Kineococcus glutinatus]|uniref:Cell division protein FtsI n=1 Tax=Kineococcus glutinatus TaxID=1070872 RepID=A0ABP9HZU8_9ACTN
MPHAPAARRRDAGAGAGPRTDRRLRGWVLAVLLVLSLFGGRLVQLQGTDAAQFANAALKTRTTQVDLQADRGDVVDSEGVVLATSVERRDVVADPSILRYFNMRSESDPTPRDADLGVGTAGAAHELVKVLGGDEAELARVLEGDGPRDQYAVVARELTPQQWRDVEALELPGITGHRTSQRVYPAGAAAATLVGVLGGADEEGVPKPLGGLESKFDAQLQGRDGWQRYERSLTGQQIPLGETEGEDAVDGDTLHLTVDRDLQWKAEEALVAQVEATQADSGTVVIMDKQQRLLAVASAPTVDPADTSTFTNTNLRNTAFTDVFEPGSTAKVVTLAAALEEGRADPSTKFVIPTELKRSTKVFTDSHVPENDHMTLAGVIAESSNIGTILAGETMDAQTIYRYQRAFGFGQETAVGFPAESAGILATPEEMKKSGTQRYTVMFGQGMSVTAVQAASVFATIANDGVRVEPQLVQGWSTPEGSYTPAPEPASQRAVSTGTARAMREMLQGVVSENGTAAAAAIDGYLVAGKTGTAQRYDEECGCYRGYTASFIGMAPADDPELVVAVILQNPRTNYYGGGAAGPVFKDVMTYALAQRGVAPSAAAPANLPLTW